MSHKAIYGKVKIIRHLCPVCGNYVLENKKHFKCDVCGFEGIETKTKGYRIMSPPSGIRKRPPEWLKRQILKKQNNRCYWCGRKFGEPYLKNTILKYLKIHWDHKSPFSYEQTNNNNNWVAACNICNSFKSSFLFKKEEDCFLYLRMKWNKVLDSGKIKVLED